MREMSLAGQLAAMGFADTARAERLLTEDLRLDPAGADAVIVGALAAAADPDLALASLARLPDGGELRTALREDEALRSRLVAVLGASAGLAGHLARHPSDWQLLRGPGALRRPPAAELREELLSATGARPEDREPVAGSRPRPPNRPVQAGPGGAALVPTRLARCASPTVGVCCGWPPGT